MAMDNKKLKSLAKKTKAGDRHPGTGGKSLLNEIIPKLKKLYPVSDKDIEFLKKSMSKKKTRKSDIMAKAKRMKKR